MQCCKNGLNIYNGWNQRVLRSFLEILTITFPVEVFFERESSKVKIDRRYDWTPGVYKLSPR